MPPLIPGVHAVATTHELHAAVGDASIAHIVLMPGRYGGGVRIHRNLILEAALPGTAILDGYNAFRVLNVILGTVELRGIVVTGGYTPPVDSTVDDYSVGYGGGVLVGGYASYGYAANLIITGQSVIHGNTAARVCSALTNRPTHTPHRRTPVEKRL